MTEPFSVSELIKQRLSVFSPTALELIDDSAHHAGHAGARDGGGHFRLKIVSAQFAGRSPIARHRMVYDALGTLMKREVHAVSITALTEIEAGDGV